MSLFDEILAARGLDDKTKVAAFLLPDYSLVHDPFLLPDMSKAIKRLIVARNKQEKITIYGDYDIDGLTATALILDAFSSFGFESVDVFMPNRFIEGYGMTIDSVESIANNKTSLIITVDCGSLSHSEITRAKELGVDVIVTDHHGVAEIQPPAVAVINPKRSDSKYPFKDLAGVGVAFKLIQAMQTKLEGLPSGQEKWLLDLVALGTVCDIVPLIDENRIFVYWGLKVLAKAKRLGLKVLMLISDIDTKKINARSLGFGLGPRMNAAGRLETAQLSLDLLTSKNADIVFEKAQYLDNLNKLRQAEQKKICKEAFLIAEKYINDSVLVVSDPDWNHGIIGIVASKLLEKYKKPVFVLQEMDEKSKGSARSFGDFNIAESIKFAGDIVMRGGGHQLAAGVTLLTKNIDKFRKKVNEFYSNEGLSDQHLLLLPKADIEANLSDLNEKLVDLISQLEPFGNSNPQPILKTKNLFVTNVRKMGDSGQHVKLELKDEFNNKMKFLAFGAPEYFFVDLGEKISVWYSVDINEWQGNKSVEGKLLHLELQD